jgi:hypothetical protein
MIEKQQKNKKGKKVHTVFNQVGFILLVQVSQYTVISAWNSMITPAVKWFLNGDIMTTNKLPGMYVFF